MTDHLRDGIDRLVEHQEKTRKAREHKRWTPEEMTIAREVMNETIQVLCEPRRQLFSLTDRLRALAEPCRDATLAKELRQIAGEIDKNQRRREWE